MKGTRYKDLVGSFNGTKMFLVILNSNVHSQKFLLRHLRKVCVPSSNRQLSGPILRLLAPLRIVRNNKYIQLRHGHD
jgi:hypothetical protein